MPRPPKPNPNDTARTASLMGRALIALVLMVGFYALAIGLALFLLWLPFAEMQYAHRIHLQVLIFCLGGAFTIIAAIFPRFETWNPPGPQLRKSEHPKLFTQLEGVAKATGQAMPSEVYLVPDVNAWVAQRGGFMGFGSKRVMGIGLPLMQLLSTAQFRGVLAHEFGHYHGGDTALGPLIYTVRASVIRAVQHFENDDGTSNILQLPFIWYAKLFLRITHAISRHQEFGADRVAAGVVGAQAMREGLQVVHQGGHAFHAYVQSEVLPVLRAGYRPPFHAGFTQFLASNCVKANLEQELAREIHQGRRDPYDTHPTFRERIAALSALPSPKVAPSGADTFAVDLLGKLEGLEAKLVTSMFGTPVKGLKPTDWDRVALEVFAPIWAEQTEANVGALKELTVDALPADREAILRFSRLLPNQRDFANDDHRMAVAVGALGSALATLLAKHGWTIHADLGEPITCTKGEQAIKPFEVLPDFLSGKQSAEAWRERCSALGISGLPLGAPQAKEQALPAFLQPASKEAAVPSPKTEAVRSERLEPSVSTPVTLEPSPTKAQMPTAEAPAGFSFGVDLSNNKA